MPSIFETYEQFYNRLERIQQEYISAEKKLSDFELEDEAVRQARIENFEKQLKDIGVYYARVEYFRELAEQNISSTNVSSLVPLELDFNSLREDARKINKEDPDDPYANRLFVHARCNEIYLEHKQQEFTHKLEKLKNGENVAYEKLEKHIRQVQKGLEDDCARLIRSPEFNEFASELKSYHFRFSRALYDEKVLTDTSVRSLSDKRTSIGAFAQPLPLLGEDAKKAAEDRLNHYYAGDKAASYQYYDRDSQSILLPVVYDSSEEAVLEIRTVTSKENRCFKGLNTYLLNLIRKTEPGNRKFRIQFLDAIHLNNSQLKALRPLESSCVLGKVPQTEDDIMEILRLIVAEFPIIDETLQDVDTVREYNASVSDRKDRIERKVLVLAGYPTAFSNEAKKYISRILYNHERYGITVILVDNIGYVDGSEEEYKKDKKKSNRISGNYYFIEMLERKSSTIDKGDGVQFGFRWYEYDYTTNSLPQTFISAIRVDDELAEEFVYEYNREYPLEDWRYRSRSDPERKKIVLPYGFNRKSKKYSQISFGGESFAAYLMGASGSGKSTLLHTLISGILRNYHPDDVELWLADFKMAEFSQYIDPLPPHVKYILLDESPELVYDLVDKLTEEMLSRQKFFMKSGDIKKVEDVPANVYMPIIFVILDEFSIMSQVLQENDSYKLKLQNLLAKGRALGIKFIFSSQSYMTGIRGLTDTAKEQIQTRIAMKNGIDEIEGTLELPRFLKTEENIFMIETLPVHQALRKFHVSEDELELEKVNVLYFKGKNAKEAFAPQRKMIGEIQRNYQPVERGKYTGTDDGTYVEKRAVIVDGNSYEAFIRDTYVQELDWYKKTYESRVLPEDVLISYGSPRRMERIVFSEISNEARENILVLARNNEQPCTASIALSAIKAFLLQNGKAEVWAYERNPIYRTYNKFLCANPIQKTIGLDEICRSIKELKQKIKEGEVDQKLIVLLGMDHICVDFEFVDTTTVSSNPIGAAAEVQNEEELKKYEFVNNWFMPKWDPIEARMRAEGKDDEEIDRENSRLMDEEWPRFEEEYAKRPKNVNPGMAESQDNRKKNNLQYAYNAKADFEYVIKQGSRLGYHFLLVLNSYKDLKPMGLKLEYFRNRIGFQMSKEESLEVFGKSSIGVGLPEHVCQFHDTVKGYSFRPYLHKGIEWDGWSTDGKRAISPFNIDE